MGLVQDMVTGLLNGSSSMMPLVRWSRGVGLAGDAKKKKQASGYTSQDQRILIDQQGRPAVSVEVSVEVESRVGGHSFLFQIFLPPSYLPLPSISHPLFLSLLALLLYLLPLCTLLLYHSTPPSFCLCLSLSLHGDMNSHFLSGLRLRLIGGGVTSLRRTGR